VVDIESGKTQPGVLADAGARGMSGLAITIPIAILMGVGALVAFLWALRSGQYEDIDGAGQRVLDDDGDTPKATASTAPNRPMT
jgi:cbb3-type cytochrome oxidase maturation protein